MVRIEQFQNLTKREFINFLFSELKKETKSVSGITRGIVPFFLIYLKDNFYKKIAFILDDESDLYEIYEETLSFDENKDEAFLRDPDIDEYSLKNFIKTIKIIDEREKLILFIKKETLNKRVILEKEERRIKKGDYISFEIFIKDILNRYNRVNFVEKPLEFSVRGGIIDFYPLSSENPIRLIFDGDKIDKKFIILRINKIYHEKFSEN